MRPGIRQRHQRVDEGEDEPNSVVHAETSGQLHDAVVSCNPWLTFQDERLERQYHHWHLQRSITFDCTGTFAGVVLYALVAYKGHKLNEDCTWIAVLAASQCIVPSLLNKLGLR